MAEFDERFKGLQSPSTPFRETAFDPNTPQDQRDQLRGIFAQMLAKQYGPEALWQGQGQLQLGQQKLTPEALLGQTPQASPEGMPLLRGGEDTSGGMMKTPPMYIRKAPDTSPRFGSSQYKLIPEGQEPNRAMKSDRMAQAKKTGKK